MLKSPILLVLVLLTSASFCSAKKNANSDIRTNYHQYFEDYPILGSISPDGKHYAYGIREGTELFLCIQDLDTGDTRKTKVGEDAPWPNDIDKIVRSASMRNIYWPTNERIVYKPDSYRLFSIGLDLQKPVELLVYRNENENRTINSYFYAGRSVRNLLMDEPDYILVESSAFMFEYSSIGAVSGSQYDFYRVNIHTGSAVSYNGAYGAWDQLFVDANGTIRGAVRKKARRKYELHVADPDTAKLRPIRELLGDEIVEKYRFEYVYGKGLKDFLNRAVILDFGFNPEWMFFASNADRDTFAIYAINLRTKEVQGPLLDDKRFDIVNPEYILDYSTLLHSSATRNLAAISTYFENATQFWIDPKMLEAKKKVDAKLPNIPNRFSSWSDDLKRFVISTTNGKRQWETLLYDSETDTLKPIFQGPPSPSVTFPVWIPAEDGHQILCYLTIPKSSKPGIPNKTIALFHGGPWSRDYMGPSSQVRLLVDQGYSVLRVNFRGSVGFGKIHTMAAQKRFGDAALEDALTAINWCIANKLSQAGDIVAMGGSYGGYLALYASAKHPDLFRQTVAIAPVTDLIKIIKEDRFESDSDWANFIFSREMIGNPKTDRKLLEAQSPSNLTKSFEHPVLLIHGEDDITVPPSHSKSLFQDLKKLSDEHAFLSIKKAGHGGWSPEQLDEIYSAIIDFIE